MGIKWSDPNVVQAIANYARVAVGVGIVACLAYMMLSDRVSVDVVIRVLLALLALDRGVIAMVKLTSNGDN